MKVVARRTGLSSHVIRVWERRYNAVTPSRTGTNRRLYSDAEIERLSLLGEATRAGHAISQIARLEEEQLRELIQQARAHMPAKPIQQSARKTIGSARDYFSAGQQAIQELDGSAFEAVLSRAASGLGQIGLLQQVLVPLIHNIGALWKSGTLKVAHEHMATAVIRSFLGSFAGAYGLPENAPRLLVTTPPGQLHELGAIMVAVTARNQGWQVTYLGPCLPAEEIAGAAIQNRAQAVALSLVYPEDDPYLEAELGRLRRLLPREVVVLAGGRASVAYGTMLDRIGAIQLDNLPLLQAKLDELRKPENKTANRKKKSVRERKT